jgi:hypothetical protein
VEVGVETPSSESVDDIVGWSEGHLLVCSSSFVEESVGDGLSIWPM